MTQMSHAVRRLPSSERATLPTRARRRTATERPSRTCARVDAHERVTVRICAKHGLHALTATFRAIAMSTTTRPSPMVSLGVLRSPDASQDSFNLTEGRRFVYDLATAPRGTKPRGARGTFSPRKNLLSAGFFVAFPRETHPPLVRDGISRSVDRRKRYPIRAGSHRG